jgi:penicillin amidase
MKRSLYVIVAVLVLIGGAGAWYLHSKQPVREGEMSLPGLRAAVSVRYDERGVPHLRAENQDDLYRALGYVHAQDRLFQMEILRRLARGELAEVLGPKLVSTDKLFRSLRIREHADAYVARQDKNTPAWKALQAYLDGINHYQATHPKPIEFDVLGIPERPFTAQDTLSVGGYLAYSFAAAFRTEPLMTYVRDQLGPEYLKVFDLDWQPRGALGQSSAPALSRADWKGLNDLALLSQQALEKAGLPQFEGSNAWAVSGSRTQSGKPLLAGDPHIRFSVPAVWYEAQLTAPGFELYGHFQALNPFALLGHNLDFGWSLTMFQNDDLDLIAEKTNPENPNQVWYHGAWVDMTSRTEQIDVKGESPVTLTLRQSPHGPIVNDALGATAGQPSSDTPIAMWWSFLESDNPILQGFYDANRADTLDKMRSAAEKIQSPGLNIVYANAKGDIGWWAAAQLPKRPAGVNPTFILDGSSEQADKNGFYPFTANPQEENPARGYIVSANFQPVSPTGMEIPGYYNLAERGRQLDRQLSDDKVKWNLENSKALQLGTRTDYAAQILTPLLPALRRVVSEPEEHDLLERMAAWNGEYSVDSVGATLFNQFLFNLTDRVFHDELSDGMFSTLLSTRLIDMALPRLAADADSPWWNNRHSREPENRDNTVKVAWHAAVSHLRSLYGQNPDDWTWGKAHTLTHEHPLSKQPPLDLLFNVGPFAAPGTHEVPNNLSASMGPAPWPVTYGPSTRRLIDFADPAHALGINPVGQSGVLFDKHYADQAPRYIKGEYVPERFSEGDVTGNSKEVLKLVPGR